MNETTQENSYSVFSRVSASVLRFAPFPQQIDPTRQIHRCCGRAAHQIAKGKEVPTWIRLPSS